MSIWLVLLTIGLPWLGGICVLVAGDQRSQLQHRLASLFAVAGGLLSLGLLQNVSDSVVLSLPMGTVFGDFTLVADGLGVTLAIIAAIVGGLAVIFSNDYMKGEAQLGRYYALTFLFIGAMIGLVLSGSLLFMFVFWEITAFCSYALISFHNDDPKAVAGGIKALIMTQIGGVGLLIGAIIAYTYLGSYQISTFLESANTLPASILGLAAFSFLVAAAAKSAQIPFQTWLPDAMEAPTPISALIHAATMVNAGVYLLARFYPAFESVNGWGLAVTLVGALSALLAALMAVTTNDLKRTLAYSTISQLGYMVYAIGIGAVFASQFHLISHSVFKALLFLGAGSVIHAVGTRDMYKMAGTGKQMPFVRVVFIIGAFALAGLPITNGFFSKELILEAGNELGPSWIYLIMLFSVGVTGLYSARMVALVFFAGSPVERAGHDAPSAMRISLSVLAFGTLTTWLLAGPFSQMLAGSLPFHDLHVESTMSIVVEVLRAPATWIAMIVIVSGITLWYFHSRLIKIIAVLDPLARFLSNGMGFEWLNRQIIRGTQRIAAVMSLTQTGLLSWNVVAILAGLLLVLAMIAIGY